jgi:hypothetical protein
VRSEEVLQRGKEVMNIQYAEKGIKVNWTGHILRRNCLLKHDVKRRKDSNDGRMRMKP